MSILDHDVAPVRVILSANGQAEFGPLYHQFVMYQPNLASDKDFERVPVSVIGLGPTRANLEAAISNEADVVLVDADLFPDDRELLAFLNAQLPGKVALVIVSAQKRFLVPTIRQVASVRQIALKGELRDIGLIHTIVQIGLSERAVQFVNTPASVLYDQVSRLASPIERVNALAGTRVFAIAGSKGGPGKSTIALNFAARLSQRGLKTLLISFDTPCGIWAQLGLPISPNALNWFRRPGREGFEASRVTTKFGLDVILSPNDTAEAAAIATSDLIERLQRSAADRARAQPDLPVAAIVSQAADEAQREAAPGKIAALIDAARDYHPPYAAIVCDLPPTLGTEWSIQPLLRASIVLCVIEPSRADAMNLLNAVRILTGTLDPRYRVPRDAIMAVLNRVTDEDELNASRIMDMIRPHLGGWAPPFIATIPHDPLVRQHQVNFVLPIDKRDAFRKGIDTIVDTFYGDALAGRPNGSGKVRFAIKINVANRNGL
jgi:MinD-like ATPase involved in chromosome partitioning or flagellar assembly